MPEPAIDDDVLAERVRSVWQEVLEVEELDLDDVLPDLSTRSVKIVEVSVRLYRDLGVEIPIETFFEATTLREFSAMAAGFRSDPAAG